MKHDELEQQIDLGLRGLSHGAPGGPPALAAGDSAPPAPDISAAWAAAHTRAAGLRRRNTMRNTTLMLLLAGLLTVAGLTLWPRGNGWAVTDGWIVEYEIEVPAYYGFDFQSYATVPECPQYRLSKFIEDWSAQHADSTTGPSGPVTKVRVGRGMPQKGQLLVHRALVHIEFAGGAEKQLEELLTRLKSPDEGLPVMASTPQRFSKTWYKHEKWPEFYEPRKVFIDGRAFNYPEDFSQQADVETLANLFPPMEAQHDASNERAYYKLLSAQFMKLSGVGVIVRTRELAAGRLSIRTISTDDPFAQFGIEETLGGIRVGGGVFPDGTVTPEATDEEYIDALARLIKEKTEMKDSDFVTLSNWELVYLLLPSTRFEPGQAHETYAVSDEDRQSVMNRWAAYEAAVNTWLEEHPQCKGRSYGHQMIELRGGRLLSDPDPKLWPRDEPHSSFRVLLTNVSPELRDDLRSVLDAVDPQAQAFCWKRKDRRVPKYLSEGDHLDLSQPQQNPSSSLRPD